MGRELPKGYRTRLGQTPNRSAILPRHMVDHDLRMPSGRDTLGFVDVLQTDRDAMKRPAPSAGGNLGLVRARCGERLVAEHADEGVELAVELLDAGQATLHELHRREFALGDQRTGLRDRQEIRDHCQSSSALKEARTRVVVSRRSAWIAASSGSPGGGKIWAGSASIVRLRRNRVAISSIKWAAAAISGISLSGMSSPARASAASISARVMACVFTMHSPLSLASG